MSKVERILVLAPHPDDGEFGAGASINRWKREGCEIRYVAFSPCLKSLPEGSTSDLLRTELQNATACLGMEKGASELLNYPVRDFYEHRQPILEDMIRIRKEFSPDLVLVPNSSDIHQDHQVIHNEGLRAFKHSSIIGYELPWNDLNVTTNFHVKLQKSDLEAKLKALHCYHSQEGRNYLSDEFIFGLARVRGVQVANDYAEGFELIRWIY